MRVVRVYDPSRQPRDWTDIIEPGQCVVFASLVDGGAPCDANGTPTTHEAATCIIVDSLAEADTFCHERVEHHPAVRFDVFDAAGRSRPPLLTVVHPVHRHRLEGDPSRRRRHLIIAIALIAAAPVLFWIDWRSGGAMVLPTVLGFNALLFAARLLQLNAAHAAAERRRLERMAARDDVGGRDGRDR